MKAKHTFKYTYEDFNEDFSPVEITFDIPTGELSLTQMLYNFQCYLRACGFVFEGSLEIIDPEGLNDLDWGDENGLSTTSSSLEVEKNKWVHGMCNPPTKESKQIKNEYSVPYDENGIDLNTNSWYHHE